MGVVCVTGDDRGQLVLLAAAALAVALVPLVLSYLQLGYHADVAASGEYDRHGSEAERVLERTTRTAAVDVSGEYAWSRRAEAVDALHRRLERNLSTLRRAGIESGTAYRVEFNRSAASNWRGSQCPTGPDRQFGPCEDTRGVVVQERAGETHVLAVAMTVTITTERGYRRLTFVIEMAQKD